MSIEDIIKHIQDISNANEGFGALIMFILTLLLGWITGIFSAIIKKPKLKVRFIEKTTFYSFFETGNTFHNQYLNETFDYHKTAFAVYMSIANIGSAPTSIDRIWLGYTRNSTKFNWFKSNIVWLRQWHILENFMIKLNVTDLNLEEGDEGFIVVPSLKLGGPYSSKDDFLEVGKYINGVAYFEQMTAWGNYSPKSLNDKKDIKIRIKLLDIYGVTYHFKTTLKYLEIDKAREFNPNFGMIEYVLPKN